MYTTIFESDFHQAFVKMRRENNFSHEGRNMLFDYLEQYEEETGEQIELDVIALCCEYTESTYDEVISEYNLAEDVQDMSDDEKREYVLDYLDNDSFVVGYNKDFVVYQQF